MTDLSPAAQAVLTAIHAAPDNTRDSYRSAGAAALRALAVRINGADAIRQDVLDIAAELERQ
jgi:hypothetical protein